MASPSTRRRREAREQARRDTEALFAAAATGELAQLGGAAGAATVAQQLASAGADSAKTAALILALLAALAAARGGTDWIVDVMEVQFGDELKSGEITDPELREAADTELAREAAFIRGMEKRLRRDIPTALKEDDPGAAVDAVIEREQRYMDQHDDAAAARVEALLKRRLVKRLSPDGAYWILNPTVKEHTPDCVAMAAVGWWPWEVLDQIHPPVHTGCRCDLLTRDEAIGTGYMGTELPNTDDAVEKARQIADEYDLKEAEWRLEPPMDERDLVELFWNRRYPKGTIWGGRFMPKRGGFAPRISIKEILRRLMGADAPDIASRGNQRTISAPDPTDGMRAPSGFGTSDPGRRSRAAGMSAVADRNRDRARRENERRANRPVGVDEVIAAARARLNAKVTEQGQSPQPMEVRPKEVRPDDPGWELRGGVRSPVVDSKGNRGSRIRIGLEHLDDIERLTAKQAAGQRLTHGEALDLYEALRVVTHEMIHGSSAIDAREYADRDDAFAMEEAVTEDLAHALVIDQMVDQGNTDILRAIQRDPDNLLFKGGYRVQRAGLRRILDLAGIPDRDRRELLERLSFGTPSTEGRIAILAELIAKAEGVDMERAEAFVRDTMQLAGQAAGPDRSEGIDSMDPLPPGMDGILTPHLDLLDDPPKALRRRPRPEMPPEPEPEPEVPPSPPPPPDGFEVGDIVIVVGRGENDSRRDFHRYTGRIINRAIGDDGEPELMVEVPIVDSDGKVTDVEIRMPNLPDVQKLASTKRRRLTGSNVTGGVQKGDQVRVLLHNGDIEVLTLDKIVATSRGGYTIDVKTEMGQRKRLRSTQIKDIQRARPTTRSRRAPATPKRRVPGGAKRVKPREVSGARAFDPRRYQDPRRSLLTKIKAMGVGEQLDLADGSTITRGKRDLVTIERPDGSQRIYPTPRDLANAESEGISRRVGVRSTSNTRSDGNPRKRGTPAFRNRQDARLDETTSGDYAPGPDHEKLVGTGLATWLSDPDFVSEQEAAAIEHEVSRAGELPGQYFRGQTADRPAPNMSGRLRVWTSLKQAVKQALQNAVVIGRDGKRRKVGNAAEAVAKLEPGEKLVVTLDRAEGNGLDVAARLDKAGEALSTEDFGGRFRSKTGGEAILDGDRLNSLDRLSVLVADSSGEMTPDEIEKKVIEAVESGDTFDLPRKPPSKAKTTYRPDNDDSRELSDAEADLMDMATPSALMRLTDGKGPVEKLLRRALDTIGVDPYDVDLKKLERHSTGHEALPESRLNLGGRGISPCATFRWVDFAVHVLLPELLAERYPELARRLRSTSPRWGWRTGRLKPGIARPDRGLDMATSSEGPPLDRVLSMWSANPDYVREDYKAMGTLRSALQAAEVKEGPFFRGQIPSETDPAQDIRGWSSNPGVAAAFALDHGVVVRRADGTIRVPPVQALSQRNIDDLQEGEVLVATVYKADRGRGLALEGGRSNEAETILDGGSVEGSRAIQIEIAKPGDTLTTSQVGWVKLDEPIARIMKELGVSEWEVPSDSDRSQMIGEENTDPRADEPDIGLDMATPSQTARRSVPAGTPTEREIDLASARGTSWATVGDTDVIVRTLHNRDEWGYDKISLAGRDEAPNKAAEIVADVLGVPVAGVRLHLNSNEDSLAALRSLDDVYRESERKGIAVAPHDRDPSSVIVDVSGERGTLTDINWDEGTATFTLVEVMEGEEALSKAVSLDEVRIPEMVQVELREEDEQLDTVMPSADYLNSESGVSLRLLDEIIANLDRHGGNLLVDSKGRVYAIDHDLSFTLTPDDLPQDNFTFWDAEAGALGVPDSRPEALTPAQHGAVRRLASDEALHEQLKEIVPADSRWRPEWERRIDGMRERAKAVLARSKVTMETTSRRPPSGAAVRREDRDRLGERLDMAASSAYSPGDDHDELVGQALVSWVEGSTFRTPDSPDAEALAYEIERSSEMSGPFFRGQPPDAGEPTDGYRGWADMPSVAARFAAENRVMRDDGSAVATVYRTERGRGIYALDEIYGRGLDEEIIGFDSFAGAEDEAILTGKSVDPQRIDIELTPDEAQNEFAAAAAIERAIEGSRPKTVEDVWDLGTDMATSSGATRSPAAKALEASPEYEDVREVTLPNGELVVVAMHRIPAPEGMEPARATPVIVDFPEDDDPSGTDLTQWLTDQGDYELYRMVDVPDWNGDFWRSPQKLYHGTVGAESVKSIMENGLEPRDESRAPSNRDTGEAVFTHPDSGYASSYYGGDGGAVIEIDTEAMKRDGFTPEVYPEDPAQEYMIRQAVIEQLGFDQSEIPIDIGMEESLINDGISLDTIVVYDTIPPKYLRVVSSGIEMPTPSARRQQGSLPEMATGSSKGPDHEKALASFLDKWVGDGGGADGFYEFDEEEAFEAEMLDAPQVKAPRRGFFFRGEGDQGDPGPRSWSTKPEVAAEFGIYNSPDFLLFDEDGQVYSEEDGDEPVTIWFRAGRTGKGFNVVKRYRNAAPDNPALDDSEGEWILDDVDEEIIRLEYPRDNLPTVAKVAEDLKAAAEESGLEMATPSARPPIEELSRADLLDALGLTTSELTDSELRALLRQKRGNA